MRFVKDENGKYWDADSIVTVETTSTSPWKLQVISAAVNVTTVTIATYASQQEAQDAADALVAALAPDQPGVVKASGSPI